MPSFSGPLDVPPDSCPADGTKSLVSALRRDAEFYAAIVLYGLTALAVALWLGDPGWFAPWVDMGAWIACVPVAVVAVAVIWPCRAGRSGGLATAFRNHLADWPRRLAGVCLFLWLGLFLGLFTSFKTMMPHLAPFAYDGVFAGIDHALHGADPWTYLQWMANYEAPVRWLYGPVAGMLGVTSCFLVCVSDWERRRQFLWAFFFCWVVLGNILPLAFMAGGPVFYHGLTGSDRFSELSDFLFAQAHAGDFTSTVPAQLWQGYIRQKPGFGTGISAFPSMHVSMATLLTLGSFARHRRIGYAMAAFLLFVMAASVHLGWHYAVDGYVSVLATTAIWNLAGARSVRGDFVPSQRQLA